MGRFTDKQEEIGRTVEFQRISKIIRREMSEGELETVRVSLTQSLRRPGGEMSLRAKQALALHDMGLNGGLVGIMRVGCHAPGTHVLMFDGTSKTVENVVVGDKLMGPDSTPRTVTELHRGIDEMYKVVPVKGDPYTVNSEHVLCLKNRTRKGPYDINISVRDYLGKSSGWKDNAKGYRTGVAFEPGCVEAIEPYMIGMWLGDGTTNRPSITTADIQTKLAMHSFAKRCGNTIRKAQHENNQASTYHVVGRKGGRGENTFAELLRLYNLLGNKHIPHAFKANTREVRLEVLAGLMDSDGSQCRGGFDFISKLEVLADDVCFLARSLGLAAYKTPCRKECVNNGVWGDYFRVSISGDCSVIPCRLPRKKAAPRRQKKSVLVTGVHLEAQGPGQFFGFSVEGTDHRFLLGDFTVVHNSGKTLVSLLAPAMFNPEPRRPLLITKASLIGKTRGDSDRLRKDWLLPTTLQTISYESLGRVSGAFFLDTVCCPDLIILDECHFAKNKKAGVTRRLVRYAKANPDCKWVVLSGTMLKASLKDAAHLIRWALKSQAPVPVHDAEVDQWADALDAASRVNPLQRHKPGALLEFATKEDWQPRKEGEIVTPLIAARRGFQRRLIDTPGVVATGGDQVDCSLNIIGQQFTPNAATESNFDHLRATWRTPDDWQMFQAVEVWACARQLALGFHYAWSPRPPEEWLVYRKLWAQFVRETLKTSGRGREPLDTPRQVADACRAGRLERAALDDWEKIRPTFTPNTVVLWHDDTALKICEAYAEKTPGIIWTEHSLFARELSKRTGLPYFGREGLDANKNSLDALAQRVLDGKEKPRAIICSIKANATGRNLQGWQENLITSIPTEAAVWEQMLGRTHRDGQTGDEVNVTTLFGCFEHIDGWTKAVELAEATQDTEGSSQKLCMATCVVPPVVYLPGPRWQRSTDEDDRAA